METKSSEKSASAEAAKNNVEVAIEKDEKGVKHTIKLSQNNGGEIETISLNALGTEKQAEKLENLARHYSESGLPLKDIFKNILLYTRELGMKLPKKEEELFLNVVTEEGALAAREIDTVSGEEPLSPYAQKVYDEFGKIGAEGGVTLGSVLGENAEAVSKEETEKKTNIEMYDAIKTALKNLHILKRFIPMETLGKDVPEFLRKNRDKILSGQVADEEVEAIGRAIDNAIDAMEVVVKNNEKCANSHLKDLVYNLSWAANSTNEKPRGGTPSQEQEDFGEGTVY